MGTIAALLIYCSYFILRVSITDAVKRGRIASIYFIFAFMMMMVFIFVLPRLTDSLHPGNGGNPGFSKYDLDSDMRLVFLSCNYRMEFARSLDIINTNTN